LTSNHFLLRFALRNPRFGRGLGLRGVEDNRLIDQYAKALEGAYEFLINKGWRRPKPVKSDNRIRVFVFDTHFLHNEDAAFFDDMDKDEGPYIGLRCIINEPTRPVMLERARIEAAHEVTHLFNHAYRQTKLERAFAQRLDPRTCLFAHSTWDWFDEASAVFVESEVEGQVFKAQSRDSLRYAMHWAYRPELELMQSPKEWPGVTVPPGSSAIWCESSAGKP
jgi:hypothetical protein